MNRFFKLFGSQMGRHLRKQFLTGIFVMVPLGVTILILVWIFSVIDGILQPIVRLVIGHRVPGIGFMVTLVLIYLAGLVASNIGGRKLIRYGEHLLAKIPLVRPLYNTIKQIAESFSSSGKSSLMQTVLLEFPRKGIWTIGFITSESTMQSGIKQLNILIPTAPNPTSGFLQIVSEDEVIRTSIPIDEALKMVVSAGKVSPKEVVTRLSKTKD